jgi:hypothetical protein
MPVVDLTAQTLKLFGLAPAIVHAEPHTIADHAVTLNHPTAAILNICSATACIHLVEPSATLGTGECQLAAAVEEGAPATLTMATALSGVVYVSYITQAWREVWDNRVASEALATASHVATLDNVAVFVESLLAVGTTGSNRPKVIEAGDAAATGECEVDQTDAGADNLTTLTFAAADAILSVKCTYIKLPASGFLYERFKEAAAVTMSGGKSAALNPALPVLFHSFCGQLPDSHAAGQRAPHTEQMLMDDALGSSAEFNVKYFQRPGTGITGHVATNDATTDTVTLSHVWGTPDEIPGIVPLELAEGTSIAGLSGRLLVIGRRA